MNRNYRAKWHDYCARCIYHITLLKNPDIPPFGKLAGNSIIPVGTSGSSYIISTPLGKAIKEALRDIPQIHPALRLYQYSLMPDHLHLLLSVEYELDEIIGRKIALFKNLVNIKTGIKSVFASGFNDQILKKDRDLNSIFNYLRTNPYRLAIRRRFPDFFQRRDKILINGMACSAYGNFQLLDNPFKEPVIVHRADDAELFAKKKELWLHTAANGGVLVSPFISKREKEIRQEAVKLEGRLILITDKPFSEREKSFGRDFELCTQGKMLIIAPTEPLTFGRAACIKMNSIAEAIIKI